MDYNLWIKRIIRLYNHISDNYFYVSYITVLSILMIGLLTDVVVKHIFVWTFDDFSISQIIFYLIGNLVMCVISHTIINKYFKRSVITVVWILPLMIQWYHIILGLF